MNSGELMKKIISGIVGTIVLGLGIGISLPASASYNEEGHPRYDRSGPGLRNWRCLDRDNGWAGPWRFTRSGAYIDCVSYNSRA